MLTHIQAYCEYNSVAWKIHKNTWEFFVDSKPIYFDEYYESEEEVLSKSSTDVQYKKLENMLNSMNAFLLLLVIYFLGQRLKYWGCIGIKIYNVVKINLC